MSLISVNNLTFCYEGSFDNIFTDVSFMIDTDWKLGFVGRNGRGKTTFLNLLQNKYEYSGSIKSSVKFDYFPFEIKDKSLITLDIINGIVPDYQLWMLERELSLLDVDIDCLHRSFDTLSGGEQSKVLLASLFLKENNFLLIDEPTNHLDTFGRQTLSKYLSGKKSFILVSHDRCFLDGCVDHILSINKADIEVRKGNFSVWLSDKEKRDNFERAENEKLRGEIDRLKDAAKRSGDWASKGYRDSTGGRKAGDEGLAGFKEFHRKKAGKLDSQVKVLEKRQSKAIEEKSKLLKNIESVYELKISPLKHYSERLVEISNLSVSYGDFSIFEDFNMHVNQGERIALTGKNGSGKSSILKLVFGENVPYSGDLRLASKLKISYVPQDTSWLCGNLRDFAIERDIEETLFKAILSKLDFSKQQFDKDISQFSAGQKKKVLIAGSLCENAHLYIWDEPLNYIDILSRMQIEELILKSTLTMLFVEHDEAFTEKVASRKVQIVRKN